jgi:hypothetical protein
MAQERLDEGLAKVQQLFEMPENRQADAMSGVFDTLRLGIVAAKKEEGILNGRSKDEMMNAMKVCVTVGQKRKMLKGRCNECLKIVLQNSSWVKTALTDAAFVEQIKESLDKDTETIALLEVPEPVAVAAAAHETAEGPDEDEGADPPEVAGYDGPDILGLLKTGLTNMATFNWEFPHNPLGTQLDDATTAFQSFFEGLTKLTTTSGAASLGREPSEVLAAFESEWAGLLAFCLSMYQSTARRSYRSRVKFVVVKLQELSPSFNDEVGKRTDVPWITIPRSSWSTLPADLTAEVAEPEVAPPVEETRAVEEPEPPARIVPKPGVVWIDYKRKAYTTSSLTKERGITFMGFHDDPNAPDYQPSDKWLSYIVDRVQDPHNVVDVVIVNKVHMDFVRQVRVFCTALQHAHPRFIVVTRAMAKDFAEDLGIDQDSIVKDWGAAAKLAMEEVRIREERRAARS